jgi:hypothetical protein
VTLVSILKKSPKMTSLLWVCVFPRESLNPVRVALLLAGIAASATAELQLGAGLPLPRARPGQLLQLLPHQRASCRWSRQLLPTRVCAGSVSASEEDHPSVCLRGCGGVAARSVGR